MERKQGYYWVKFGEYWDIAFWREDGSWRVIGSSRDYTDVVFDEINENVIDRN